MCLQSKNDKRSLINTHWASGASVLSPHASSLWHAARTVDWCAVGVHTFLMCLSVLERRPWKVDLDSIACDCVSFTAVTDLLDLRRTI